MQYCASQNTFGRQLEEIKLIELDIIEYIGFYLVHQRDTSTRLRVSILVPSSGASPVRPQPPSTHPRGGVPAKS
jgi:hypothetical protein